MKLATGQNATDELVELLTPGNKVRVFAGEDRHINGLYHILAIVDGDQVVYKVWGNRKQRWFYRVEDAYLFAMYLKEGWLSKA